MPRELGAEETGPPRPRGHQIGEAVTCWRGVCGALRLSFPPSDWLHCRHMTRRLSRSSLPPREDGMMWSISGDCGWRLMSQLNGLLHSGHGLPVGLCSAIMRRRLLIHLVVPVLLLAMLCPWLSR